MKDKIECTNCLMEITYLSYQYDNDRGSGEFNCPVCGRPIAWNMDDADLFLNPQLQYTDKYRG